MDPAAEQYVPKIHPATRPVEPEDPMTLYATPVAGDPEVMLQCLAQEYAWLGWGAEEILGLFHDSFYPALNELLRAYGEDGIRERLTAVLGPMGVFRFTGAVRDDPEPELIQLGIRGQGKPEGTNHAAGV